MTTKDKEFYIDDSMMIIRVCVTLVRRGTTHFDYA